MTEDKKNKIRELRMRGYGYSTIADFISEKRDNVRNYCRYVIQERGTICPLGDIYAIRAELLAVGKHFQL